MCCGLKSLLTFHRHGGEQVMVTVPSIWLKESLCNTFNSASCCQLAAQNNHKEESFLLLKVSLMNINTPDTVWALNLLWTLRKLKVTGTHWFIWGLSFGVEQKSVGGDHRSIETSWLWQGTWNQFPHEWRELTQTGLSDRFRLHGRGLTLSQENEIYV